MPTYSYRCTECGNAFDVQQSFTDASLTVCPSCSGMLRKVFSPVGVSFTGSGFYRNDSRATPAADKGNSGESGKSGDKTTGAAAAKPSEKSGAKESKSTPTAGSGSSAEAKSTTPSGGRATIQDTK